MGLEGCSEKRGHAPKLRGKSCPDLSVRVGMAPFCKGLLGVRELNDPSARSTPNRESACGHHGHARLSAAHLAAICVCDCYQGFGFVAAHLQGDVWVIHGMGFLCVWVYDLDCLASGGSFPDAQWTCKCLATTAWLS